MSSQTHARWQNYDRFYVHGSSMGARPRQRHPYDYTRKFARLLAGEDRLRSVLDIGCADGKLVAFLKSQGFVDVVGVDINQELLTQAGSHTSYDEYFQQ